MEQCGSEQRSADASVAVLCVGVKINFINVHDVPQKLSFITQSLPMRVYSYRAETFRFLSLRYEEQRSLCHPMVCQNQVCLIQTLFLHTYANCMYFQS